MTTSTPGSRCSREMIKHHVKEEEEREGMFAKARQADMDLVALGEQLAARKAQLMGGAAGASADVTRTRYVPLAWAPARNATGRPPLRLLSIGAGSRCCRPGTR